MEIKLNKKMWAPWIQIIGNQARLDLMHLCATFFSLKKETSRDFIFTNCSTADVEIIASVSQNGLQVKSRYSKKFVDFDDPIWRG